MDRSFELLSWWKENGSIFENLEMVLPFIVCDGLPQADDSFVRPVLIGAATFQADLMGTCDPRVLHDELANQPAAERVLALSDRKRILERWEPEITFQKRSWHVSGKRMDMTYARFLAPVRTSKGGKLLITHTAECSVH